MSEIEKDLVFSQAVKAGKRIYYFDVKLSRNGERYVSITESKKIVEGTPENPQFSFEKHKIFLYKEDYEKFLDAMIKTLEVAKEGMISEEKPIEKPAVVAEQPKVVTPVESAPKTAQVATETPVNKVELSGESFKIDLDF